MHHLSVPFVQLPIGTWENEKKIANYLYLLMLHYFNSSTEHLASTV